MIKKCTVCGSNNFGYTPVLWQALIEEWELNEQEVDYINRQQGFFCKACGNNLRSMALAMGILKHVEFKGTLSEFAATQTDLRVLEINRAGNLTATLASLRNHTLIEYPAYDMMNLSGLETGIYDLVIHSDTLEHISNPELALSECRKVLADGGACIYTIPIIFDRMSRRRDQEAKSYHGSQNHQSPDLQVVTEFGADFWREPIMAGFSDIRIGVLEWPSAVVIALVN